MRSLFSHARLVAVAALATTVAASAVVDQQQQHHHRKDWVGAATTTVVPLIRVDNPSVVGKARAQNACDKCSLCLAKTGNRAEKRTLTSIYDLGEYIYSTQQAAVNKCLANRFCREGCQVKSVTYTLPPTPFVPQEGAPLRILATTSFPSQSYLLNVDFNIIRRWTRDRPLPRLFVCG